MWNRSNNFYIVQDHIVGWRGKPGFKGNLPDYTNVPISLNHNGWRINPEEENEKKRLRIHIYGCSYVFGVGISDGNIFVDLLRKEFPDVHFENCALPGYSTTQGFLHLQRDLRSSHAPDLALFCFLDVHTRRNVASPIFLRNLQGRYWTKRGFNIQVPRAGLNKLGRLKIKLVEPFSSDMRKSDIHQYEVDTYYRNLVTKKLFKAARDETAKFGKKLAITFLRQNEEYQGFDLEVKEDVGPSVHFQDVSFERGSHLDISLKDHHPNEEGHALYAERISIFLKHIFLNN